MHYLSQRVDVSGINGQSATADTKGGATAVRLSLGGVVGTNGGIVAAKTATPHCGVGGGGGGRGAGRVGGDGGVAAAKAEGRRGGNATTFGGLGGSRKGQSKIF